MPDVLCPARWSSRYPSSLAGMSFSLIILLVLLIGATVWSLSSSHTVPRMAHAQAVGVGAVREITFGSKRYPSAIQ
jgi:hypothetical protein